MALVVGPTGLGLGGDGVLYVADTIPNRIAAIGDALRRTTSAGTGDDFSVGGAINQPLGLAVAPDGDVLVANASDGNLVDVTQAGTQVVRAVNPAGGGSLFGLALAPQHGGVYLVDDAGNALDLLGR